MLPSVWILYVWDIFTLSSIRKSIFTREGQWTSYLTNCYCLPDLIEISLIEIVFKFAMHMLVSLDFRSYLMCTVWTYIIIYIELSCRYMHAKFHMPEATRQTQMCKLCHVWFLYESGFQHAVVLNGCFQLGWRQLYILVEIRQDRRLEHIFTLYE